MPGDRASGGPQDFAVHVQPSPIDGLGVFAADPVPAGRRIGEIRGRRMSVVEARIRATRYERVMIVEVSPEEAIDFHRSTDPLRYTNHACTPNARLVIDDGRVEVHALRDLQPGEEITVRYGDTHHEGSLPCRCGLPGCVGRL